MRSLLIYIAFLLPLCTYSQFYIADSAKLALGPNTTLFTGGDATYHGPLFNSGTIVSYGDVDFVSNTAAGNLKFTGIINQNLIGDTISVGSFELDKTGRVLLLTNQVRILGNMLLTNGVVQADENPDLVVAGSVDETGAGYVEGKMNGRLGNTSTFIFPMGLTDPNGNGLQNYLTITANQPGTFVRVECRPANPNLLFPDSLIQGIADEVAWFVSVVGADSVEATLKMNYSGLNSLANYVDLIKADINIPGIALFDRLDTLDHHLNSLSQFDVDTYDPDGVIESNERVWITNVPKRFTIALLPSASEPVFYVPNAFAPNATFSDNRIFRPFYVGAPVNSIRMIIRDSFNQVVHDDIDSGSNLDITQYGWNGVIEATGLDAPDGVYYYEITLETSSAVYPTESAVGSLLLVR